MTLPHPVTGELFPTPVPPGTGWPGDPADADTPVARSAAGVARLAARPTLRRALGPDLGVPRPARGWWAGVRRSASQKRASYDGEPYWGRPVPGWGSPTPGVLIVGLAPAANGANRTGRNFTGDRSGDWIYAALHRTGLATQASSTHAGDGQRLPHTRMVATVRCAPPENKPTPEERATCAPWLHRELTPAAADRAGDRLPRRDRLERHLDRARRRRPGGAAPPAQLRSRRRGGRRRPGRARLLPPVAAQHVHRPAHRGHGRRRPHPCRVPGWLEGRAASP